MADNSDYYAKLLAGNGGISQYVDLVNRRNASDDLGDAFTELGKRPALTGNQRASNAFFTGLGSGFKGGANNARNAKLQELEKDLKQVALTNASLQTQLGQAAYKKAAFANYATDNFADLKKWNDALGAGDGVNANAIGELLFNRFKDTYPDLAEGAGNFSHVYNGMLYTNNGNKSEGTPIKDIVAPLISTLPAELQRELPNLNTLIMQNKFKQSDLLDNLAIEKERAGIANQYSSTNLHNAQADALRHEMNNPKTDEKSVAQDELNYLLSEAENKVTALGSKAHRGRAERYIAEKTPGGYGMSEAEAQIDVLGKILRGKLFNAWGYRNEAEFEQVPSLSFENSPEVNLAIIRQMKNLISNSNKQTLGSGQNNSLPQNQGQSGMVLMTNTTTGEQFEVPSENVELFKANGYE